VNKYQTPRDCHISPGDFTEKNLKKKYWRPEKDSTDPNLKKAKPRRLIVTLRIRQ
jgi:hypothetical protein